MLFTGRLARYALVLMVAFPIAAGAQALQSGCSHDALKDLAPYMGEWRVETVFRVNASSRDSTTATARITSELSGCLLREEYRGRRFGEPYTYVALWGVNGLDPRRYQRVFAHSQHGLLTLRQGRFVGDTLVLRSTTRVRGADVLEEDRISRPTSSEFIFTNRRSMDGGRTWVTTRQSQYIRLGEPGG